MAKKKIRRPGRNRIRLSLYREGTSLGVRHALARIPFASFKRVEPETISLGVPRFDSSLPG